MDEVECSEELFCLVDSALSDPEVVCVLDSDLKLYYNHSLSYHRLHVDSDMKNMNNCIIEGRDGRDGLKLTSDDDSPLNCSILNRNLLDISHSAAGRWDEGLYHKNISINTANNGDNGFTGSEGRRSNNSTSTTISSFTSSNFLDKMKKRKLNNYRHDVSDVPNHVP